MQPAIIISLGALFVSLGSLTWQLYTYFDTKKIKLEILYHYELVQSDDVETSVIFTIINHSSKQALIRALWMEEIKNKLEPVREDYEKLTFGISGIEYPIKLKPNDVHTYKHRFISGAHGALQFTGKPFKSTPVTLLYKECRLVALDIKGKEFKSKWVNIDLSVKEINKLKPVVKYEDDLDISYDALDEPV